MSDHFITMQLTLRLCLFLFLQTVCSVDVLLYDKVEMTADTVSQYFMYPWLVYQTINNSLCHNNMVMHFHPDSPSLSSDVDHDIGQYFGRKEF
jgi:hypothetical protein